MPVNIRKISAADAPAWLDLLRACLGDDYPDKQVYEQGWVSTEILDPSLGETWVAEANGRLEAAISFLSPSSAPLPAVANLGRHFCREESYHSGAAAALLAEVNEFVSALGQAAVSRALATDNNLQALYESHGYSCIGYQPLKHLLQTREGVLFYFRPSGKESQGRLPLSESLPQVAELGGAVLSRLHIKNPEPVRDGVAGYPLQVELQLNEATLDEYRAAKSACSSQNLPLQISGNYNQGNGYVRNSHGFSAKAFLAVQDGKPAGGIACAFDSVDRAVRIIDAFSLDECWAGAMVQHVLKYAQEKFSAIYVEMDVALTAPRLLKASEQLGFVPIAFIPSVIPRPDGAWDVVKLVKLNAVYDLNQERLTVASRQIVKLIDQNFQDQKVGVAIINLLRGLPFFEGLGDGELRKIARLFTQKLYRPSERIFARGDLGHEAYVIMRGQIDIVLDEKSPPLVSMGNGQIFGELAFLDGSPRTAMAVAKQASILLVIQRSAFNSLVQHEPHLGMVVMRNIALELSNRLRKSNEALARK
jgi:CRP-like cAMP-binding protein